MHEHRHNICSSYAYGHRLVAFILICVVCTFLISVLLAKVGFPRIVTRLVVYLTGGALICLGKALVGPNRFDEIRFLGSTLWFWVLISILLGFLFAVALPLYWQARPYL